MSRQFIAMGMGMGIMPGRKGWFGLGVVGRVGMRMIHGVVPVFLSMAFLVLAGLWPEVGLRVMEVLFGFMSR